MKKISFACILVLVFAVGIAYAQQYEVAPADHKDFIAEEYLVPGQDFCFDIYLTGVSSPQTAGGAWIEFMDSIEVLSYMSSGRAYFDGSEGVYGPWDPYTTVEPPLLPPGNIIMVVTSLAGAVPDGDGNLIVGRVCLRCEGPGDGFVNITTIPGFQTWTPADDTTINGNTTQPVLTIHQAYECTTNEDCQDGLWCNGIEVCITNQCLPATIIPCDDGDRCTLDCDEDTDSCLTDVCDISELSCYTDPCYQFPPCSDSVGCIPHCDADCDLLSDASDNCPNTPNALIRGTCTRGNIGLPCDPWSGDAQCDTEMGAGDGFCSSDQEDTYPPGGNGIGDACDCEADFNCDGNVDAEDVTMFLWDYGRGVYNGPCALFNECNGDFDCDRDVDADDVIKFLEDFGRNQFNTSCPVCEVAEWCRYSRVQYLTDFLEPGNIGGWTSSSKTFDEEWTMSAGEEIEVDIWLHDIPEPLQAASFKIFYDPSVISIVGVNAYDDLDLPGPWDSSTTAKIPNPDGPGSYMFFCATLFPAIAPDGGGDIIMARFRFHCTTEAEGVTSIEVSPTEGVAGCIHGESGNRYHPDYHSITVNLL